MTITNKLRTINSRNVLAKLEGSDPKLKDEFVVYTAHWDHFGKSADGIFHGAEDDALGCAALIEMARAFTKLPTPPRRSILFLAVTAEEQGLLGSQYLLGHADLSAGEDASPTSTWTAGTRTAGPRT